MRRIWWNPAGAGSSRGLRGRRDEGRTRDDRWHGHCGRKSHSEPSPQASGGSSGTLARSSTLDVAGAKDFAAIPRYPDSWIRAGFDPSERDLQRLRRNWSRYDIHYQSRDGQRQDRSTDLTEKLTLLGWTAENEKTKSGSLASTHLTKDKLLLRPGGTAYLQGISIVARSRGGQYESCSR